MTAVDLSGDAQITALIQSSGLHGHISFAHAVLEGRQPGFVTARNAGRSGPVAAIVSNYSGFILTFGEADRDLAEATLAELPNHPFDFQSRVILSSDPAWVQLLAEILPELPRLQRTGFRWQPAEGRPPAGWQAHIPPGLQVVPIDAALAETVVDGSGTQDYGIDPWFIRIAGGPRAYAALGLGLALVERETRQVASLCGVCALGGGEAELEVGTTLAYRGRGLATLISAAFIEQAVAQGWQPAYTCDSENLPSIGVAHKLGFVEVDQVEGFVLA